MRYVIGICSGTSRLTSFIADYIRKADRIIDIGAGRGDKIVALRTKARHRVAIEPHRPFLKMIREKDRDVDLVCAVVEYLPLRSGIADVVLFWNVIMFVTDIPRTVQELRRVSRHEAQIFISYFEVKSGNHRLDLDDFLKICKSIGTVVDFRKKTDGYCALVLRK